MLKINILYAKYGGIIEQSCAFPHLCLKSDTTSAHLPNVATLQLSCPEKSNGFLSMIATVRSGDLTRKVAGEC